ncbi:hypothetical protein [Micromonospora sp. WMMD812]|uniref:hypothetical protein n=1 Tax=Micromonospora sp. WMMD812 TaxID=3015152 RepID=UPI00248C2AF2|nr:hypothetical protein [Micromonospora sp. WMMD812]WBB67746.1 hypothetical protein O7603_32700 [Micromonospora sp. WMMD812]
MPVPDSDLDAVTAAASSPDWPVRAQAGRDLARWAHRDDASAVLLRLILDPHDTAVTDATSHALLQRDDAHGLRVIARALATAINSEYADHLYAAVAQHLLPDGPIAEFLRLCDELIDDSDPTTRLGAGHLRDMATPWTLAT